MTLDKEDLTAFKALLGVLRENGVTRFRSGDLELELVEDLAQPGDITVAADAGAAAAVQDGKSTKPPVAQSTKPPEEDPDLFAHVGG
jgi:hypothetical protein